MISRDQPTNTTSRNRCRVECRKLVVKRLSHSLVFLRELDTDDDRARSLSETSETGRIAAPMVEPLPHIAEDIAECEWWNPDLHGYGARRILYGARCTAFNHLRRCRSLAGILLIGEGIAIED